MGRPREFDRQLALQQATRLFWKKGYAATSTDELLGAMGIGRQSLYNAFGSKRRLYLEVQQNYQVATTARHLDRLEEPLSPLEGIRGLLSGIAVEDDDVRSLGCFGVSAVSEFGSADPELMRMRDRSSRVLHDGISARIREGRIAGEIDEDLVDSDAADFVMLTMTGLQVSARAGADVEALHAMVAFAVGRLQKG